MTDLEYTITRSSGPQGEQAYHRPQEVRDVADRVRAWAQQSEVCGNCQRLPAVRLHAGTPLCGVCGVGHATPFEARRTLVRAEPDADALQFRGLAIVFNQPSVDMGFIEYIRPQAAERNDAEGVDVRALWSHNSDLVIGRMSAGTLRTRVTSRGVNVAIDPPRTAVGYVETVRRGDVTGMSFGFQVLTDEWHLEDETPVREVTDMRYREVSAVAFPAYPDTTIRVARSDARADWTREEDTAQRLRLLSA